MLPNSRQCLVQEPQPCDFELQRRSLYATYVDKDTGLDSLKEKFPDAKNITLEQHKEQWFGAMEFESQEKAIEMMKANTDLQIDEKKVKLVRNPPNRDGHSCRKILSWISVILCICDLVLLLLGRLCNKRTRRQDDGSGSGQPDSAGDDEHNHGRSELKPIQGPQKSGGPPSD